MKNFNEASTAIRSDHFANFLQECLPGRSHTRYNFLKEYALSGIERGERIYKILNKSFDIEKRKINILDLGSGYGGTAIYFSRQDFNVVAADIDYDHVRGFLIWAKENNLDLTGIVTSAECLPVADRSFDGIIMQDFIEHVNSIEAVVRECGRVLKENGFIFVTVPNRLSVLNLISDPHYGYFGITWLPKKIADFYITHIRKNTAGYKIESYPGFKFIMNTFLSNGISIKRIDLSDKFIDPTLIGSQSLKAMVSRLNNHPISKFMLKTGLLKLLFFLFNSFISRGFILVGEKRHGI